MNKKRKILENIINFFTKKNKEETPSIENKINELKTYRFYLTYIIDNNLLGKQIKEDELSMQLKITQTRNRF